ncbi:hypothetical protein G4B88_022325 [Cannabis sativa]|uniref:Mitochondrial import inner membrane translocase subunit TIM50 n=1 Tax=Cannabis sativa TaxID=3483 RepID=A0A7J6HVH4_CANSA|nr:hypothetical protein G4B88_022325 [Cannabis sativa]
MDSWTKSQKPQFLSISLFLSLLPISLFDFRRTAKSRRDSGSFHARSASKNLNFYVLKRPGVDELLEYLREKDDKFEVVVFTAGLREYASLVLDKLDGNREYSLQPENGVLVQAFVDDVGGDCELSKFESSYEFDDIREAEYRSHSSNCSHSQGRSPSPAPNCSSSNWKSPVSRSQSTSTPTARKLFSESPRSGSSPGSPTEDTRSSIENSYSQANGTEAENNINLIIYPCERLKVVSSDPVPGIDVTKRESFGAFKTWEPSESEHSSSLKIWDYYDSEVAPASSWSTLPNKPLPMDIGRCTCVIVKEASPDGFHGGTLYSLYTNLALGVSLPFIPAIGWIIELNGKNLINLLD